MTLLELEPRWIGLDGVSARVGLSFNCPHCLTERLAIAFHHRGHEAMDDSLIRARLPASEGFAAHIWNLDSVEDFATLTVTPSVDASHAGHWHGFITNGAIC